MSHQSIQNRLRLTALLAAVALTTSLLAAPRALWKINVDGTGSAPFAGETGYRCGSPQWSPDGKFVAFDTWPANQESTKTVQIAIVRADGSDLHLIGSGAMPSWSPDGKQLVCHTYTTPDAVVVMNSDGSGREAILDHWGSPRWSPRGNRIASIQRGNIALYDLASGHELQILSGPYSVNYGFSVSPDGRHFCFGNGEGEVGGLCLATLDEQKMRASVRTLVKGGPYHHNCFSPDGKRIVFSRPLHGVKDTLLHIVDVDGKTPPELLPGQISTKYNCDPTWSPDGKTIVFTSEGPDP